jgi:release factor glutamine methyltransferase
MFYLKVLHYRRALTNTFYLGQYIFMDSIILFINNISAVLKNYYKDPEIATQYAWWTVQAITGLSKAELLAQSPFVLSSEEQKKIGDWVEQQTKYHTPIQYLIGSVPFVNMEILVKKPILIPRPETEEWVTALIDHLGRLVNKSITILDMATGTGCIALALAQALPSATVWAVDISEHAISLAKQNAQHNNICNVIWVLSDLFSQIPRGQMFDLIVSNPPYISPDEWTSLEPSVREWEDRNALLADNNGLAIIEQIITQASPYIKLNKELKDAGIAQLTIEIGYRQARDVQSLMYLHGYTDVIVDIDLAKNDRVVRGNILYVESKISSS